MLPAEQARGETLLALARDRFDPSLREIEQQVLRHSCAYEDPPNWTPDPDTLDPTRHDTLDPTRHETTGRPLPDWQGPELRPALLRWLLTNPEATAFLEPRGLRVWNARFTDPLDLIGCHIPARLELRYCLVEAPILLINADLSSLTLRNATLQQTVDAPFLKLHGPLYLNDIAAAETLNFNAANIPSEVRIANTILTATGDALSLTGASIVNDLILYPNFQSAGHLNLKGSHIGGFIGIVNADLTTSGTAMTLDDATIDGSVFIRGKSKSAGEIRLLGAHIGGSLDCSGTKITAVDDALSLDRIEIDGNFILKESFEAAGAIRLHGARIGGNISCMGAKLTTTRDALLLDGATINGAIFLDGGFEAAGEIRLIGTYIRGQLSCQGAKLTALGDALTLDSATIDGSTFLDKGFRVAGRTRFIGARIKSIYDDHASWPANGNLYLNGLHLGDLSPIQAHHLHTTGRIAWLNLQPKDQLAEPQPWLHLASHFEAKGHKRAAKRVIYELRKHQSRANWKNSRFKHLGYFWDTRFALLEEQPLRILIPILLLATLSGLCFHRYRAHFAETSDSAFHLTHTPQPAPTLSAYPKSQPFVYALENVLPVAKLGQDDKWAPNPDPRVTASALYICLIALRWFLILSGWVMGGILAAAVSARFRA